MLNAVWLGSRVRAARILVVASRIAIGLPILAMASVVLVSFFVRIFLAMHEADILFS
jgi:hypothetical protein